MGPPDRSSRDAVILIDTSVLVDALTGTKRSGTRIPPDQEAFQNTGFFRLKVKTLSCLRNYTELLAVRGAAKSISRLPL
jgi:hypothetical protein